MPYARIVMRYLVLLLLLPLPLCYAQSTLPGSLLTFYITDGNLVTNHRGIMTLSTAGLVDFTINGIPISGPSSMVETGVDTGVFQLQLSLPSTMDGRPLQNGDVVQMIYHQPADYAGNPQTITQSVTLTSVPSSVQPSASSVDIGHYFTLLLDAPNYNLDSQVPDDIPLDLVQVHMGGVSTTLADKAFDVGNGVLRETGPNTGLFAATFKIPREIDGFPVEIGSTIEFRIVDTSQPIPSESSIFVTVGTQTPAVTAPSGPVLPRVMNVVTTSTSGTTVNFANDTVLEGLSQASCFPKSGSYFPVGKTTVTCAGLNPEGTSVLRSFTVTVSLAGKPVPHWVRNLAGFWCQGTVSTSDFAQAIKYLASAKIIYIPQSLSASIDRPRICAWAEGGITDVQVLQLFSPLVR